MVGTVHPRIALTRDPEVDDALRRARPLLGERKPTATLARELILRGAQDLLARQGTEIDRRLDELGATPALRPTAELLDSALALGDLHDATPYAISEALEESREDRI
ncbi:MAG TPA: hypothetical protein VHU13_08080 [Solirubrobacteraceae bacterium]|nr:hypothetical protein [Solirubrobacteraceae bacterium]